MFIKVRMNGQEIFVNARAVRVFRVAGDDLMLVMDDHHVIRLVNELKGKSFEKWAKEYDLKLDKEFSEGAVE